MQFLDRTLPTCAGNLALDEALLLEAEAGRGDEVLRLWEWPKSAVILGAGCRLSDDVNADVCQSDDVPILRRSSGGGTVLLGKGCLLFSLVLAYERSPALTNIVSSHAWILETLRQALHDLQPDISHAGTSDLTFAGRKFSGNAQQRKRNFLLHHGTLLYDFSLERISRYLRQPARQPDYRRDRPHLDFVMNLPANADLLKDRLRAAWRANDALTNWPEEAVHRLVVQKYTTAEWTLRR